MRTLLRVLGWLILGALIAANWLAALVAFCVWHGIRYLRKPQAPRRRTTTGRIAR